MKGQFIIKNEEQNNVWYIADWDGDPGITLRKESAKRYKSISGANRAINYYLRRYTHIRKMNLKVIDTMSF